MMRNHVKSTTKFSRGQQCSRVSVFFGITFAFYCCLQIDSVKSLDTIVKDIEYTDGIKEANNGSLIEDEIEEHTGSDLENNIGLSNSHQATSHEDTVVDGESTTNMNQYHDRLWGSSNTGSTTAPLKAEASEDHRANEIEWTEGVRPEGKHHPGRWGGAQQQANVPMKGKFSDGHINPPEGFAITARVYIDSNDKLAHFDIMDNVDIRKGLKKISKFKIK